MQIVQTPKTVVMLLELFHVFRVIQIDAKHPEDLEASFMGDSVGRWEGDTLVVDTIGIKPTVSGYRGMPHSPQMRVTERIRMLSPEILHDQITIDDPVVLEKPFTYTVAFKRMASDYEMVEFVCDNNREYVDEKGIVRLKLHNQ